MRRAFLSPAVLGLALLASGCGDFFGDGPDPAAAGLSEGRRVVPILNNRSPEFMVVDADGLYIKADAGIYSVPKDGSQVLTRLAQANDTSVLTTHGDLVYVLGSSGSLGAVPKVGGEIEEIATNPTQGSGSVGLLVDDEYAYIAVGPQLARVDLSSGTGFLISSDVQNAGSQSSNALTQNSTSVFYLSTMQNGGNQYAIRSVSKATLTLSTLVTTTRAISALSADDAAVYYLEVTQDYRPPMDLVRVDLESSISEKLATITSFYGSGGSPFAMVGNETALYFTAYDGVMKWNKQDGTALELVASSSGSSQIGIDQTWVFWLVSQNGTGIWGVKR
jgi:hypothetical protein